ncbi:MAG: hypothetical protein RIG26_14885 [Thalassospira sp.]|uniref:hypothetical protein n=1 Tax=Thalassospira sp. TaxID=1912094 RepID=UPI0032EFF2FE
MADSRVLAQDILTRHNEAKKERETFDTWRRKEVMKLAKIFDPHRFDEDGKLRKVSDGK